ncbi:MAG: hypothetical protein KJO07_01545 [Deltaproteobacteria bacterium]|nr:hypothetical protein [Deltaproteobacteria bacterium]
MRTATTILLLAASACSGAVDIRPKEPTPDTVSAEALALRGTDHRGQPYDLRKVSAEKPTLVIFYRGHW